MTETQLIVGAVLLLLAVGLAVGYIFGNARCHSRHPRHFDVTEPLPYSPADLRWYAEPAEPEEIRYQWLDEFGQDPSPRFPLPERSVLARYTEPTAETLHRWQRGERP